MSIVHTNGCHPPRAAPVGISSSMDALSLDSGVFASTHKFALSDVDDSADVGNAFVLDIRMVPRENFFKVVLTLFR
jgi:hypothetical protein